ncbi:MAG TPA: ABC transporter permease [Candidatus Acidoferrales bacterium]|nr:ABC transporter permease [Candidatus Acidoferrales bacterium]
MKSLPRLRTWLSAILHRSRTERDMDAELRSHIESYAEDLARTGLPRAEALRRARLEFGGLERVKEECRESRGISFIESLLQDLRFGLRMLRKSPGFTTVAVLTLALGIGANTAIFSAVNGILLEPLPYADSPRLVQIESGARGESYGNALEALSIPATNDVESQCPAFEKLSAYGLSGEATLLGASFPDKVGTLLVDGNFFAMLGIRPLLGRPIVHSDTEPGIHVGVLDFDLWRRDFSSDRSVIGKTIFLDGTPTTIIGVMPSEFHFGLEEDTSVWLPLVRSGFRTNRNVHMFSAVARLRAGTTLEAANAQLRILAARLAVAYPKTDKGWNLTAKSAKAELVGDVRNELLIISVAVGFVLLIACVNVSGMFFERAWTRNREVAIRQALGATRLRIIRQFLTEGIMLSVAGGALGLLFSRWAIPVLRALAPPKTPRIEGLRLDPNVLWFTLGISVLCVILFGLAPAVRATSYPLGSELKEGLSHLLAGFAARAPRRLRCVLVIAEISLAVILATGAMLTARSLHRMLSVHLGFRTDHILTIDASIYASPCDVKHTNVCHVITQEMLRRIRTLQGVKAAAVSSVVPLRAYFSTPGIETEAQTGPIKTWNEWISDNMITSEYFRVMGIPLLAGREFSDSDTASSQRVAIVSRAFARHYLQSDNPLGQLISMSKDKKGQPQWMQVVGEVGDIRNDITQTPQAKFYVPFLQGNWTYNGLNFLMRTSVNPLEIAEGAKHQIWAVDKDAPIDEVSTVDKIVSDVTAVPRFQTVLLGSFGLLGLLLAMIGIYGVISYSVVQRTHEIGVRMALGAGRGDVLRMVLGEGLLLATIGIAIGVAGALALTRFLRSLLFEIKPTDPATFIGVAILLALVALTACYIPARRAMNVDPMIALRYE